MQNAIADYVKWMFDQNFAPTTIRARERTLGYLCDWLEQGEVFHPFQVTETLLEEYQAHLRRRRKHNGSQLSVSCQRDRLIAARSLFRWLHEHNRIRRNPAARVRLPRAGRILPRTVFSTSEADKILAQPDVTTHEGIRDRALLELLYSTGIRRAEAGGLAIADIDQERHLLRIREGKGRKDRVVPIGRRAMHWLQRYISEARPVLAASEFSDVLFLRPGGRRLPLQRMTQLVSEYIRQADLPGGKRGSCHTLRHTMATLMLDQGADVRYIQAMLGHAKLSTTQIYTHVSIRQLQEVHRKTHPAEKEGGVETDVEAAIEYAI